MADDSRSCNSYTSLAMKTQFIISHNGEQQPVTIETKDARAYRVSFDNQEIILTVDESNPRQYQFLSDNQVSDVLVSGRSPDLLVCHGSAATTVQLLDERQAVRLALRKTSDQETAGTIFAPMPGKIVRCLVKEGESVQASQGIIIVEAMKMENELRTEAAGTVKKILVSEGDAVEAGHHLVIIE
ncbi:MAG: biotin/lipoyl-containing protein [Pseudomonadota bacterium]